MGSGEWAVEAEVTMCVILTIGVWEMYQTSRFGGLALQVIISLATVRELVR